MPLMKKHEKKYNPQGKTTKAHVLLARRLDALNFIRKL